MLLMFCCGEEGHAVVNIIYQIKFWWGPIQVIIIIKSTLHPWVFVTFGVAEVMVVPITFFLR